MFADLHLHSQFSDGTSSPEELAAQAQRQNLRAIALTDHDSIEGCERLREACVRTGIEFISGTELSAEWKGSELHLLGYGVDLHHPELLQRLRHFQEVRRHRIREIVTRLNELQLPLRPEAVFAAANCHSPGRPHVARALVASGLCGSHDEAFERYLKRNGPAWVPKYRISALEAIHLVHAAGGLAVIAHPGLNRVDEVIPELVAAGLDGLECYHVKHSPAMRDHYARLAHQRNLLITGGSDCHGASKGAPLIGTVRLPYLYVTLLKARLAARHSSPALPARAPTELPARPQANLS